MKTLFTTTKQGDQYFTRYFRSNLTSLRQCYSRYSDAKWQAEARCRAMMQNERGYDFRILSFNGFFFTCGWRIPGGDLRVETPTNSYVVIDLPF